MKKENLGSVKALKKQLGAAVAMVCVAAVALGSSTYAWFVSNNNVTANTSSISAQSNAPFLVINAGSAVTTSTTSTDATATPTQDKALFPVQMVKAEDNASAFQWESAYAEASTSADEKDKTRFIVQTADLPNYYIKETFYVGTNGTTKGQFKNLRVSGVSATQTKVTGTNGEVNGELENALRLMVVCGEEVAIYDKEGALITTYTKEGETSPVAIAGLTASSSRTANGETVTGAFLTAENVTIGKTDGNADSKQIDVYVYYDGAVANIRTNNLNMLGSVNATLTFTADDAAASTTGA